MRTMRKQFRKDVLTGRRSFLKAGLAGGIFAVGFPGRNPLTLPEDSVMTGSEGSSFDLEEVSIVQLAEGMKSGEYTSRSIVENYLQRIGEIDRNGPTLRSVIEINPDALTIADQLDGERKQKGTRGVLHGIPVLIKDNIDTFDKMSTTAGSLALVGSRPPDDAFLVRQLRRAGMVILGKTNLSEWANIRSNHSTSGWSGRGGLTRNPYAMDRNTSGSSSGSGVAVSANLCPVAVGTETDGSIVSPSSINGIVGIKPTVGLVSRTGVIPISHTQDTPGPMARTVADATLLLEALAGMDNEDEATRSSPGRGSLDYSSALDRASLKGSRIGIVRKYFGFLPSVDAVMDEALALLKHEGATVIDPADIPTIGKFEDAEFTVLLYELKADMNAYLSRLGSSTSIRSLKDIIEFNGRNSAKEMPFFGQETFLKAQDKGPLSSKEYVDALAKCRRLSRREGIDAVMNTFKLDALVAPTEGPAWLTDLILGDHFIGGSSTAAAVAGYPSITVPAGFVSGLPVGISFFGKAWSERKLIGIAHAYEQASRWRKPPRFLSTVDLSR
jgi:amidase